MTLIKEMILLQVDTRFQLELWLMIMIVFFRQFAMRNQNYGSGTLTSSEGNSSFDLYFYQLTEKSHPRKLAPSGADGDGEMFPGAPHLLSPLPPLLSLCSQGLRLVREILRSTWQKFMFQARQCQASILNFYLFRLKSEIFLYYINYFEWLLIVQCQSLPSYLYWWTNLEL